METKVPKKMIIENVIPILTTKDIDQCISYYETKLGFKKDWSSGLYAQVSRDSFAIMFKMEQSVKLQEVWIGCHELDTLYKEYQTKNVSFAQLPENHTWAYDMKIKDFNGHILWFGAEPKPMEEEKKEQ